MIFWNTLYIPTLTTHWHLYVTTTNNFRNDNSHLLVLTGRMGKHLTSMKRLTIMFKWSDHVEPFPVSISDKNLFHSMKQSIVINLSYIHRIINMAAKSLKMHLLSLNYKANFLTMYHIFSRCAFAKGNLI